MATEKVSRGAERWLPVPGYEGAYEVSDLGNVRSVTRNVRASDGRSWLQKGRPVTAKRHPQGYRAVKLFAGGVGTQHLIHHLVARAFLGEPPAPVGKGHGDYSVNHVNGRKDDNRPGNLEWVTQAENKRHAVEAGWNTRGERVPQAQLAEADVLEIRRLRREEGVSFRELGRRFHVSTSTAFRAVCGETWRHVS